MSYMTPFLTRKTPFFALFILSRASDNIAFQNIGGTNAWAVPPPQILGDRPPVPLGLRPWVAPENLSLIIISQYEHKILPTTDQLHHSPSICIQIASCVDIGCRETLDLSL